MSMYFLDETDDWPEYEIVLNDIRRLDIAYLQLRKELKETEAALRSDPANEELKTRLDELKKKLKEVGKKLDGSLSMYR